MKCLFGKSQISAEFLTFVGIAFLFAIVFVALSASNVKELNSKEEYFLVRDTALRIQSEIDIASQVEDGYERYFTLPTTLNGIEYNVSINNNVLSVWTENAVHAAPVPNITGKLDKSKNKIIKVDNAIFVNQ